MENQEKKPTFIIPLCRMEDFKKKLNKIQRKAKKCGVVEPSFVVTGTTLRRFYFDNPDEKIVIGDMVKDYIELECNIVEVDGVRPKIADWVFVGTIEHNSTGNIIRTTPEFPEELSTKDYRHVESICDHCKTNRRRNDTYLIRNEVTNELLQVGRSCLKDFTGHASPEYYAGLCQWLLEAKEDHDKVNFPVEHITIPVKEVLAVASMFITARSGYVPRSAQNGEATGMYVGKWFWESNDDWKKEFKEDKPTPSQRDHEIANIVFDFILGLDEDGKKELNDFEFNLNATAKKEFCYGKDFGLISYMVEHYNRQILKQERIKKQKEEGAISEFFGEVKGRYNLELTFQKGFHFGHCEFSGQSITLYKFVDAKGNIFCWKTTGDLCLETNEKVFMKGSVKDHKEFNETKQTILTRCKLYGEEEFMVIVEKEEAKAARKLAREKKKIEE